jgi:hypothetical protein
MATPAAERPISEVRPLNPLTTQHEFGGSMRKVDPAALLVAVLAVGVSPMMEDGAWGLTNSIVASVVLAVVLCFTLPRKSDEGDALPTKTILFAQSVVIGFIFAIGSAAFWQWVAEEAHLTEPRDCANIQHIDPVVQFWDTNNCKVENEEKLADAGTTGGLVSGGVITGVSFWLLTRRVSKLRSPVEPAPNGQVIPVNASTAPSSPRSPDDRD